MVIAAVGGGGVEATEAIGGIVMKKQTKQKKKISEILCSFVRLI